MDARVHHAIGPPGTAALATAAVVTSGDALGTRAAATGGEGATGLDGSGPCMYGAMMRSRGSSALVG
eukprot:2320613-Prorocentrum_lima.AAC.1